MAIGVLLDTAIQERWIVECLRQILTLPRTGVTALAIASGTRRESVGRRLHRLFDRLDEHWRCRGEPLFARSDVTAEFSLVPIRIASIPDGDRWHLDESGTAALQRCDVDLWLCFSAIPPGPISRSIAGLGLWGIEIGEGVPATSVWAGAMEVGNGSPVTMVKIVDYAHGEKRPLYQSYGATAHHPRRNRLRAVRKGLHFFKRVLESVTHGRRNDPPFRPATLPAPVPYPGPPAPTIGALGQLTLRLASNWMSHRMPAGRRPGQWQIAYQFTDEREFRLCAEQLRFLVPPEDRYWADPFAIEHQGRYFIFFEELRYGMPKKGRLAVIEVFEHAAPGDVQIVLEEAYHLSYPFVFHWDNALYMIPESSKNRTVALYRCEEFPARWRRVRALLSGVNAVDATLWKSPDRWWMFVNIADPGVDNTDELHLYWSATPIGPWVPHPHNPVVSDVRCARSAGPLFAQNGQIFRPSQDCSMAYGHAVWINRIDLLDESGYRETPVSTIGPGWRDDVLRVHTIGSHKRLQVIDCMRNR